jgi:hypothetical protein
MCTERRHTTSPSLRSIRQAATATTSAPPVAKAPKIVCGKA